MVPPQLRSVLQQIRTLADPHGDAGDGELLRRFAARREEADFARLLLRHGPMVLGVARRVLGSAADAEDVFQATFLLLARKADSVDKPESVACWLHGVARRLAVRAKVQSARRQTHERQAADMRRTGSAPDAAWRELQGVLDDALRQVPAKYRAPLVLCYLEGKSHEEAARQLGCSSGTVGSWLARGRKLLRDRLTRRGVTLSGGALATALMAGAAPVEAALTEATVRAALRFAAGEAPAALLPGPATALLEAGMQTYAPGRARIAVIVIAFILLGVVGGVVTYRAAAPDPTEATPEPTAAQAEEPPQRRAPADLFGDPLPPGAIARLGTQRFRHTGSVEQVAFSPDGRTLASGSDNNLWIWEADTGKLIRHVAGPRTGLHGFAFLPGVGPRAVLSTGEDRARLWDFASGPVTKSLPPCTSLPNCSAVSRDGTVVALRVRRAADGVGYVRVYEPSATREASQGFQELKEVRRFETPPAGPLWMVLSPDGTQLLTPGVNETGTGSEPTLWDVATGEKLCRLPVQLSRLTRRGVPAAFSPDGGTLALAAADGTIRLWDARARREVRQLPGHQGPFSCLVFSPNGRLLGSGASEPALRTCDVSSGLSVHEVQRGYVVSVSFSSDGRTLATGWGEGVLRLLDARTGIEVRSQAGHENGIQALAIAGDGRTAATVEGGGTLRLWETATGRELRRFARDGAWSTAGISSSGQTVIHDDSNSFRICRVSTGEELRQIPHRPAGQPSRMLAVSADGRTLAFRGPNKALQLWDVVAERMTAELQPDQGDLTALAFSPDGRLLATAGGSTSPMTPQAVTVRLWDVATGRGVGRFGVFYGPEGAGYHQIRALAFAPDGRTLATASSAAIPTSEKARPPDGSGPVRLWDATTGREIGPLSDESGPSERWGAGCVAFSPDGQTLAVGEADSSLALYDVASGRLRTRLRGHAGNVRSLAFSGDGQLLVSAAADLTALVWDLTR